MSVSTHIYSYPEAGVALKLDIYFAPPSQVARNPVPSVVFFHGGSLISGNRDFLCKDIKRDTLSRGWAFISADYRLLIPSTGHEILRDVKSLFAFLADAEGGLNKELRALGCPHQIDSNRLYVGGSSAGAYPAFLAALFAQPKPKGFFSLYGVGGDLLSEFYLPRLRSGFRSSPSPSPINSRSTSTTRAAAESANTVVTTDLIPGTNIPGHRARIGGQLRAALHQSGTYLDILMGMPGLSEKLGQIPDHEGRCQYVAQCEKSRYLFPQIWIDRDFPPSIVIHGDADAVVSIEESKRFVEKLQKGGVEVVFLVAEGKGHQFEERASPEVYVQYIKPVVEFLRKLS
ncbi:alpha/beta-hydrolase [Terfezia boudieri ATCC MYA-4762]|uniref:Alpha/beta-hydrolase n=1 Tax=Terfezia boudieri ATCC MYA-4762 TaxID=1051890 RepID=A0A3N4LX32_9PEZI|nr:alpha/beta-hydrolase [Terfezia boudieri ATCC MYA-4762]